MFHPHCLYNCLIMWSALSKYYQQQKLMIYKWKAIILSSVCFFLSGWSNWWLISFCKEYLYLQFDRHTFSLVPGVAIRTTQPFMIKKMWLRVIKRKSVAIKDDPQINENIIFQNSVHVSRSHQFFFSSVLRVRNVTCCQQTHTLKIERPSF